MNDDLSLNVWKDPSTAYHEVDFDIENYEKFYENHFFQPLPDYLSVNVDTVLPRARWAVEVAQRLQPKKILDLGCLEGFILFTLQNRLNYELKGTGVDLSTNAIELAKARNKKFNMQFKFVRKSIEAYMTNSREKFDLIIIFETMEHVKDPELVLKLIDKMLSKGGSVLISTPAFESPHFGLNDEHNKAHIRLYTTRDEDYEQVNGFGHVRKATSLSRQVGKQRIKSLDVSGELINCLYQ